LNNYLQRPNIQILCCPSVWLLFANPTEIHVNAYQKSCTRIFIKKFYNSHKLKITQVFIYNTGDLYNGENKQTTTKHNIWQCNVECRRQSMLRLPYPRKNLSSQTTKTSDKIFVVTLIFKTLGIKQLRKLIPKRWKTNKMNPIIAQTRGWRIFKPCLRKE
jgi:hypothetical protein